MMSSRVCFQALLLFVQCALVLSQQLAWPRTFILSPQEILGRSLPGVECKDFNEFEPTSVYQQYATPHYFVQHLKRHNLVVGSYAQADVVYVDISCYSVVGQKLQKASESMMALALAYAGEALAAAPTLPYWNNGLKFLYLLTHSGDRVILSKGKVFTVGFRPQYLVVTEGGMARTLQDQLIIAPYLTFMPLESVSELPRKYLGTFVGGCRNNLSLGQAIRSHVVDSLLRVSDSSAPLFLQCTCSSCPGNLSPSRLESLYKDSIFCFLPLGDTRTSRRLTEIIVAGCIPVFVHPWHEMPFSRLVNYSKFSVFVDVEDTHEAVVAWSKHLRKWWRSAVQLNKHIPAPQPFKMPDAGKSLLRYLSCIPDAKVAELRQELRKVSHKFVLSTNGGIIQTVLDEMALMA